MIFQEANKEILTYLNNFAQDESIKEIVMLMADLPIFFLPIFFLSMWLWKTIKKDQKAKTGMLLTLYSIILTIILNLLIQQVVIQDRPETAIENKENLILNHIPDASFPSDHAWVAFAFVFWLAFFWYRKTALLFAPFAIIMTLSRVASWVHWPLDIIGWIITAFIATLIISSIQKKSIIQNLNKLCFFIDFPEHIRKLIQK